MGLQRSECPNDLTATQPNPSAQLALSQSLLLPQVATAPVLVLVGAMMMGESDQIDWRNMLVAVPAFLTIVVQPFTFSIANGIYAGLVMSALVYFLTGTFVDVGRDYLAMLRGDAPTGAGAAVGDGEPDALDGAEAGAEVGGKDEGSVGPEAPLLGGGPRTASVGAGSAADLESLGGSLAGLRTSDAISITHRRGSRESAAGSLSRSHPYERGSFGMLVGATLWRSGTRPAKWQRCQSRSASWG
jgi:hypothetical protein